MLYRRTRWTHGERVRFYCAALLVGLARFILLAVQRGFSVGLIDIRGIEVAVRISERIRSIGWYLVRSGRRRYRS